MIRMQGVWVGGGALLVLAGAMLVGGAGHAGRASGQATASMSIAPASKNVPSNGETFNVEIKVANVTNLGAYDFTVTFDSTLLEYIGSKDNGLLASTGRPQSCIGFGLSAATVNAYKALHAGCGTNGLIQGGVGIAGPNGSGTLATIAFKPKAVGTANLVFVGFELEPPYFLGGSDPTKQDGAVEQAHTSLTLVEVCQGNLCQAQDVSMTDETGVVGVYDPSKATPTALPPTPTPEPRTDQPESEQRKTVAAAIGTPRLLGTPVAGATSQTGTTAASDGTGDVAGSGTGTGSGGTGSGGTLGATGGPGSAPGGVPRGPDGAPIAGYGPQEQAPSPWWLRSGLLMLGLGLASITLGAARRTAVSEQPQDAARRTET